MKPFRCLAPVIVLLAVFVMASGCNQNEGPVTMPAAVNPAAAVISVIDVEIDIVPHKPSNQINCGAKNRLIAVAFTTTATFDATTVDHTTVEFEGAYEAHIDDVTGEPVRHEVDVDEDGDLDLLLHFLYRDTDLTCQSTEGCLTGETYDGVSIQGCDFVSMFRK